MSDFLGDYGFFILIALLMVVCHMGHAGHGGHRRRNDEGRIDRSWPEGEHRR